MISTKESIQETLTILNFMTEARKKLLQDIFTYISRNEKYKRIDVTKHNITVHDPDWDISPSQEMLIVEEIIINNGISVVTHFADKEIDDSLMFPVSAFMLSEQTLILNTIYDELQIKP